MPPTTSSSIMKVECPLCFHSFPIDQVEQHADGYLGSFGLVEENSAEGCVGNDNSDAEILAEKCGTDNSTLAKCINNLKDNALKSEMEMVRITVRRKMVWEDYKRARYSLRYYQPDRVLKVTFAGEPAVDDGGPKREFFAVQFA